MLFPLNNVAAIVLVCLTCMGHGRRVHTSHGTLRSAPFAQSIRPQKASQGGATSQSLAEVSAYVSKSRFNPFKRLRGGGEEDSAADTLTREQIIDKLNRVPTFCLVTADEMAIPIPNAEGGRDVCFFIDAAEAQDLLNLTIEANADAKDKIHLAVSPLGVAFELCGGFKGLKGEIESDSTSPYAAGALKICGQRAIVQSAESALQEQLKRQGVELGNWVLPIMCHNEVDAFFFSGADFKAGWSQLYGEEKEVPENVALMDLRLLVNQMMSVGGFDWKQCQFVSSMQAVELARDLQTAAKEKAAAMAAAGEGDADSSK